MYRVYLYTAVDVQMPWKNVRKILPRFDRRVRTPARYVCAHGSDSREIVVFFFLVFYFFIFFYSGFFSTGRPDNTRAERRRESERALQMGISASFVNNDNSRLGFVRENARTDIVFIPGFSGFSLSDVYVGRTH